MSLDPEHLAAPPDRSRKGLPTGARNAYPPIEKLGVIGDRRTAALAAADGTIGWLCWPNFESRPIFASLLDDESGGFWRLGPAVPLLGRQRYAGNTATLVTRWTIDGSRLELTETMAFPHNERQRGLEDNRTIIRRLRCLTGASACVMDIQPRIDFGPPLNFTQRPQGASFRLAGSSATLWGSVPTQSSPTGASARFTLGEGEEGWFVLSLGGHPVAASADEAARLVADTERYWQDWVGALTYFGPRGEWVRRSAITFHLLSYAPTGALVAAPTASLPERVLGDRNYDYRYAWIRDVSLTLAIVATLGDLATAKRYMDWLSGLGSDNELPLQVLYRIDGGTRATQTARDELNGYRGSKPVRFGNHADQQYQIDSLGYLADCALIYLKQGGAWRPDYWHLIRRIADYVAENWHRPTNGIWELSPPQHHVTDRVMAWVTLERASRIAGEIDADLDTGPWSRAMEAIHAEVMDKGWSDTLQAFRQRYDAEALDASVLLMATMGFLPADHPRMRSTINAIGDRLTRDGLVYRFDPQALAEPLDQPLGEAEGAFLPCTFWYAAARAMLGETDEAESILRRVEEMSGELQLFAEEADPKSGAFLGNTPMLFSHATHMTALLELAKARPVQAARLMTGQAVLKVRSFLSGEADGDKATRDGAGSTLASEQR